MATIASLLADHVTLQVRSVDRLFLQGYVPRLMTQGQVVRFLLDRGFPIPSPALLGKIGRAYVDAIERFAARARTSRSCGFGKGESQGGHRARATCKQAEREGRFGVVLIGVAQEKTSAWRGWRDGGSDGHPHFEFGRQSIFVEPLLLLHPRPGMGAGVHQDDRVRAVPGVGVPERARVGQAPGRQAAASTSARSTTAFAACHDAAALAEICGRLSRRGRSARSSSAGRPGCRRRSPRRTDARGYVYELAFRQLEISDTRVFDRPAAGRAWFERTLPDQLTLGRPDQIAIVFARRDQPPHTGPLSHQGDQRGVEPAIQVHYRASKVKQYFKEGRALRTETTVNDTRDFGIGRLRHQRELGRAAADRPPDQRAAARPLSLRRARARPTPRRSSASCCRPPTTAYPPPAYASATHA